MFWVATVRVVAFTARANWRLTLWADASVTVTVKFEVPRAVGVPVKAPLVESVRPVGRAPADTAKVYAARPPEVVIAPLYGTPMVPAVRLEVVMDNVVAFTVNVNWREAVCADPSVTWTVKFELPNTVGVPVKAPPVDNETPAGSVPAMTVQL